MKILENIEKKYNKHFKEKKDKWCSSCHCKDDCEDKDKILNSDDDSCPWYL